MYALGFQKPPTQICISLFPVHSTSDLSESLSSLSLYESELSRPLPPSSSCLIIFMSCFSVYVFKQYFSLFHLYPDQRNMAGMMVLISLFIFLFVIRWRATALSG